MCIVIIREIIFLFLKYLSMVIEIVLKHIYLNKISFKKSEFEYFLFFVNNLTLVLIIFYKKK